VIELAPGVRTRVERSGHVIVDAPSGATVDIGPDGYRLLAELARPSPLADTLWRIETRFDPPTVAPTIGALNQLLEESAVALAGDDRRPTSGWADPVEHGRMLHDVRRTGDFVAAIERSVAPDDVVVDVGTGSGVLAVAAARAGARHVYAIEATDIADVAEAVFAANDVSDRITLLRGWSRQLELPEPADLLVAEIIGNEPFEEEILETTLDARHRLLGTGGRLIPSRLSLQVRPLRIPEPELRQRAVGPSAHHRWNDAYGIDFAALVAAAPPDPVLYPTGAELVSQWQPVGPAVELAVVDLATITEPAIHVGADVGVDRDEVVNALAMTFCADLGAGVTHELDPWRWSASSWAVPVWVLPDGLRLDDGEALRVAYTRRVPGTADGLTVEIVHA
jgi:hypothetical protein